VAEDVPVTSSAKERTEIRHQDEARLIRTAKAGDKNAFGELYLFYAPRIYSAVYGLLMNRDDALEVTQVTFLRAWRAIRRFDVSRPFYPWLYKIARNRCYSRLADRKKQPTLVELEEARWRDGENRDTVVDLREDIGKALAKLKPEFREIIILRHFEELSYREIALIMGCPEGTVMSRLHAARRALRQHLKDWEDAA
jgi:RNA polymerase sigma-70 factor (ECF subfamily)